MQGFFHAVKTKKVKEEKAPGSPRERKQGTSKALDCETCRLYKDCLSPKMEISGEGRKKILVIAEAPGAAEDKMGSQFTGDAGNLLRGLIEDSLGDDLSLDLDKDCWKTNSVVCRPPKNRTPTNTEIACCRKNIFADIERLKPEKIIILGKSALQSIIGEDKAITGIEKYTGWAIPDQKVKAWIFPTYHPSYLLRNPDDVVLKNLFISHLRRAIEYNEKFPDYSDDINSVEIIENAYGASIFIDAIQGGVIAFDIETTGIKPHAPGHKIVSMAISLDGKKVTAFPFFDDPEFFEAIKKLMENPSVKKIAHNLKFEDTWLNWFGIKVKGWDFDTMLSAHILDNRSGITGLKDQVYFNFGVQGYDDKVDSFIRSGDNNANAFNKISECDLNTLLLYNGLDALYTMRLAQKQGYESLKTDPAYSLLHEGILELSKVEANGININADYYSEQMSHLERKLNKLNSQIMGSKEVEKWAEAGKGKFNFNSGAQLRELLFDVLKYKVGKETKKGNASVDGEALENIDSPFVKKILEYRKLSKIKDTYLDGFFREAVNGVIHPVFNLNTVKSYRSSSNSPNFQNIPKRDKYAQEVTRGGLIPSKGNILAEVDYSGVEVRISACYHKDPVMINYINDPLTDMHRDQAKKIFIMEEVTKELRHMAKNMFIFPQFYGDYYRNCASSIWKESSPEIKAHLKSKGIGNYDKFERHMREIEDIFWNKHFKEYTRWKTKTWNRFQKVGEIHSKTGFVYQGHMAKNDVLNYAIQGSAFHCLLWSLIQINKYLRKNKMRSKIIGQIHDSIIFDMSLDEKEELKKVIRKIMTIDLREHWDWIIVPLDIEMEVSEVDGDWFNMKKEEM